MASAPTQADAIPRETAASKTATSCCAAMPLQCPLLCLFPTGGLGMTPCAAPSTNGQAVPSLPPPPLQPPNVPMSPGPVPPDPYTHYAPVAPSACCPPCSPSGYPCLPPLSGAPSVWYSRCLCCAPTCNVPWRPHSCPQSHRIIPTVPSRAHGMGPRLLTPSVLACVPPPLLCH